MTPNSDLSLSEILPDEDYRFHLTLRRGDPRTFFAPQDPTGAVLRERADWIKNGGSLYASLLPEGRPLLAEFANLIAGTTAISPQSPVASDPRILGAALEPDFLLLSPDEAKVIVLRGGALCFPTGWALEEKIGRPLEFIHKVVPTLNAALARPIDQFLSRLTPGNSFLRANWGIAATPDLNMHPVLKRPAPATPVSLDRLWLRVEHQIFVPLPSGGIVFGIRIALHRLGEIARDKPIAAALARALRTMSAEVAAYKRLDVIRTDLATQLYAKLAKNRAPDTKIANPDDLSS